MAITISRATANGAFFIIGSTDETNTVYGKSSYSETFIFLGKSHNPWYGTNDLSGTFTIADVSNGDTVSIGSWDSPKAFNLSIKSVGNNVVLTQTASTDAQHWNPSLSSGAGDYEDYTGTGTYNLNALIDGETITVKLGFLTDAPRMANAIQISGVDGNLYYSYIDNDTALVTDTAFTYGGYEYGQHLISSTADYIGLFNNSDSPIGNESDYPFNEARFYVDLDTTNKALTFLADDTTSTISFAYNDDGTVTFSQDGVNAFVKTVTSASSIDSFTPSSTTATTKVTMATSNVASIDVTDLELTATAADWTTFENSGVSLFESNDALSVKIKGLTFQEGGTLSTTLPDLSAFSDTVTRITSAGSGSVITYTVSETDLTGNAPASWTAPQTSGDGATVSTTSMDILNMTADKVALSALLGTSATLTSTTTLISTAAAITATGAAAQSYKGTYSATAATFTSNASGTDSLLVYDNDGAGTGTTLEALVLVGATSISVTSGVFTTA
jgi:hypothetical protein